TCEATTCSGPSSVSSATTGLPAPVEPSADSSSSAERASTKLPTICPPAKPISIRTRSSANCYHLRKHAVHRIRMDERNLEPEHALSRCFVDQLCSHIGKVSESGADVVHLVCDVVDPRAPLCDEPTDRRVVAER